MLQQVKTASGINLVLGIWLLIAPFLLGYSGGGALAMWNDIVVGVIVLILAWIRFTNPESATGLSWTNAVLGVWLILAPFILGYSGIAAAMWNDILVGVAVAVFGTWSAMATRTA